ncbi:hypothetical protein K490DRAFT_66383 [Saccharata proteae CBS 121410]|uniref:Uncharacterized protein n=1 Tax=Saccharata proteae CBS 121410 TaxID=1314787 RepID=A0A9P4HWM4_9PEZI|nr:hypothetical protein K490DRAFT_66383 [Saccharata proteae CBS 121410]
MPAAVREDEIAFNRASVALARSQALIASWLPAQSAENAGAEKSQEEREQEERLIFVPGSEFLGVGAAPPKEVGEGSSRRNELSSNEKLRKQLLGKNAVNPRSAAGAHGRNLQSAHAPVKRPANTVRRPQDDSDDEEEGRAAAFKSKKAKLHGESKALPIRQAESVGSKRTRDEEEEDVSDEEEAEKGKATSKQVLEKESAEHQPKPKSNNFLDQILEERSQKKKKKKKKKRNKSQADTMDQS